MQQQDRDSIFPFRKQPYEMNRKALDLSRILRETIDVILGSFPSVIFQPCVQYHAHWSTCTVRWGHYQS